MSIYLRVFPACIHVPQVVVRAMIVCMPMHVLFVVKACHKMTVCCVDNVVKEKERVWGLLMLLSCNQAWSGGSGG